jgi:hypothetical protein
MPDDVTKMLEDSGVPVTRANYIAMSWGDDIVEEWTSEHELELPEELQDWSRYETVGSELVLKAGASPF